MPQRKEILTAIHAVFAGSGAPDDTSSLRQLAESYMKSADRLLESAEECRALAQVLSEMAEFADTGQYKTRRELEDEFRRRVE